MRPSRHLGRRVLRVALELTIATLLLSPMVHCLGAQELRLDPRAIVTLLPRDAIPAIRDPTPLLVPAAAVRAVRDSDPVLGVSIGEESRAYPIALLSWHEIVNDVVGGVPVAATWSPLCYTGIVYARERAGRTLTFGVSGKLVANGLIMYDDQTDSQWSQVVGQAVTGPLQGTITPMIPATQTTWETWKRLHPKTLVLDPSRSPYRRDYSMDPYEGYYASPDTGVIASRREDQRLVPKALVIGLRLDGAVKAYPFTGLGKESVVNDTVSNLSVVVTFQERVATGQVFSRQVGGHVLTFVAATSGSGEPLTMRDEQTGSLWSGLAGMALEGTLKGERLTPVPATYAFWFAWKDYYPETVVYGEERSGQ
ncbi:MAG TPA: DUF3179 domain-containing protein [Candidatus Tectomicrobia bacterium]